MDVKTVAAAVVRHALTVGAGALATHGLITGGETETIVSAGMALAGVAWSIWDKVGRAAVLAELAVLRARIEQRTHARQAQADAIRGKFPAAIVMLAIVLPALVLAAPAMADPARQPSHKIRYAARAANDGGPISSPGSDGASLPAGGTSCRDLLCAAQALKADVIAKTVADLEAADALAGAANPNADGGVADMVAHLCYPAQIRFLRELPAGAAGPPAGPIELFERARLLRMRVQAGVPSYLRIACAPLIQDEVSLVTKIFGMLGIKIAGAGLGLPPLPGL